MTNPLNRAASRILAVLVVGGAALLAGCGDTDDGDNGDADVQSEDVTTTSDLYNDTENDGESPGDGENEAGTN